MPSLPTRVDALPADYRAAFLAALNTVRDAHALAHCLVSVTLDADLRREDVDFHGLILSAASGLERLLALEAAHLDRVETHLLRAGARADRPGAA